jgi:ribonuclease VapC
LSRYVLDSFAILAVYRREAGEMRMRQLLTDPRNEHWMSVVNLGELYYRVGRERGVPLAEQALEWFGRQPVQIIDAGWRLTRSAAGIKAAYALSYADCFAAALARQLGAAVVTGDPEFVQLERDRIVEIEWLPPKPKSRRR